MYRIGQLQSNSEVRPRSRPIRRVRKRKSSGTVAMLRPPFSRTPAAMSAAFCWDRSVLKPSRSCFDAPRGCNNNNAHKKEKHHTFR